MEKSEGGKKGIGLGVEVKEEEEEVALPGFRFHPTDEELVGFYLRRKVENKPISIEIIKQIDIYKYDPWDLPKVSTVGGEKEWYFFCLRGRKYRNSIRPNRVTGSGFWKATGIDRPIHSASDANDCVGLKKSLVYYRGSAGKGTKTDWMMHEYRLPSSNKDSDASISPSMQEAEIWTICRIFKRNVTSKKYQQQGWKQATSRQTPADSSSKSSSLDSGTGDEYRYNQLTANYIDERNQFFGCHGQWINPAAAAPPQASLAATLQYPGNIMPNPNTNESWDELGRIMEYYMMDPNGVSHECRYY